MLLGDPALRAGEAPAATELEKRDQRMQRKAPPVKNTGAYTQVREDFFTGGNAAMRRSARFGRTKKNPELVTRGREADFMKGSKAR